jgi:hypothetical protein
MSGIYRVGTRSRFQAARREDGTWFERERFTTPWGKKWGTWYRVSKRPDHAWFDPAAGQARLPKE